MSAGSSISCDSSHVKPEDVAEQFDPDHMLPIANISRIMKQVLPDNAKIAKDAKECVQECVSEFIQFVTSEASDKCRQEKRKTINGDDVIWALGSLGFEKYVEPLKVYLHKWRESLATLNPALREKIVQEQKAAASGGSYTQPSYAYPSALHALYGQGGGIPSYAFSTPGLYPIVPSMGDPSVSGGLQEHTQTSHQQGVGGAASEGSNTGGRMSNNRGGLLE